jgi:hypothetical protein
MQIYGNLRPCFYKKDVIQHASKIKLFSNLFEFCVARKINLIIFLKIDLFYDNTILFFKVKIEDNSTMEASTQRIYPVPSTSRRSGSTTPTTTQANIHYIQSPIQPYPQHHLILTGFSLGLTKRSFPLHRVFSMLDKE